MEATREDLQKGLEATILVGREDPLILVEGSGARITDINGKTYIDCTSQAWSVGVGFQNPIVLSAVRDQLEKIWHVPYGWHSIPRLLLAKRLSELAPGGLDRVLFQTTGADGVDASIRMAVKATGKQTMISLWRAFHGSSTMTMNAGYVKSPRRGLQRFTNGFVRLPNYYCYRCPFDLEYPSCDFACARFIDKYLDNDDDIAGVIVEPIQGNGGQIPAPEGYLAELRKICTDHDVVLIFDEVQTGFGRCGTMTAADYYGVYPDIMVVSKALASGFPIAAVLTSEKWDVFQPGDAAGTHRGHPLSCAAALATLDLLEEGELLRNATAMGAFFMVGLRELAKKHDLIGEVRGVGLGIGIELVRDRKTKEPAVDEARRVIASARDKGVILAMAGMGSQVDNAVVKIKPPLCITEEEAKRVLEVVNAGLSEAS